LQKDPEKRADIKELLNYPYLKKLGEMREEKEMFKKMLLESFSN
jgi:hypothetical protein